MYYFGKESQKRFYFIKNGQFVNYNIDIVIINVVCKGGD